MRKLLSGLIVLTLIFGLVAMPVSAQARVVSETEIETAMRRGLDRIVNTITEPQFGSVGGEWAVLALARGNHPVPAGYFERYLAHIGARLDALTQTSDPNDTNMGGNNWGNWVYNPATGRREVRFSQHLATENARLILALASLGVDVTAFTTQSGNTYDLVSRFGSRHSAADSRIWGEGQGSNGVMWPIIAMDTRGWNTPFQISDRAWVGGTTGENPVTVADRIDRLLEIQRDDGGWVLQVGGVNSGSADISLTAMAVQSLAPHRDHPGVEASIDRALSRLSQMQLPSGGFAYMGNDNVQSAAQVIVALTALGIDPQTDSRFITTFGSNPVTRLLEFQDPVTGGFWNTSDNIGNADVNLMATEQGSYGLVAYWRFLNEMDPLYDMRDAFDGDAPVTLPGDIDGLPGRHEDVRKIPVTRPGRTFEDIATNANRAAIEALASRGIINGMNEREFAPNATMTRAQFATIITQALGLPTRTGGAFDDVTDQWFANAVGTAVYYGIVQGRNPQTFDPNGTITRQEAAIMVTRAASIAGMDTAMTEIETLNILAAFGDYRTAANWAWSYLAFCYREGILDDSEFYIEPLAAITRGEIAEMVYRLLGRANLL